MKSFKWQDGESFDRLLEEMNEVAKLPNRRIEFHEHHTVVKADGYEGPPINDIHICPVDCP